MGVAPVLGRTLQAMDEHERVVVLGNEIWRRRFHADHNVLGKAIDLNAQTFTIIGVMPESFRFPTPDIELWSSMAPIYELNSSGKSAIGDRVNSRSLHGYRVVGRLRPGLRLEQGQAEMNTIAERLYSSFPIPTAAPVSCLFLCVPKS